MAILSKKEFIINSTNISRLVNILKKIISYEGLDIYAINIEGTIKKVNETWFDPFNFYSKDCKTRICRDLVDLVKNMIKTSSVNLK